MTTVTAVMPADWLARYEDACLALAEAKSVDAVLGIKSLAEQARTYARQAKNRDLEINATEIRIRAERRLGEIMVLQRESEQGLNKGAATRVAEGPASPPALADVGIDKHLADRARKLAKMPKKEFDAAVKVWHSQAERDGERVTVNLLAGAKKNGHKAKKKAKAVAREAARTEAQGITQAAMAVDLSSVCDLRVCSCRDLFASGVRPDAVITDPPYPAEFLPVFSELAEACRDAEVPLVAVMSGQSYLPEVMRRLCEHLTYRWTLAYLTPGGQAVQQFPAKVNTFWKPVLLFGAAAEWFGDVAKSNPNDNDKRFHGWGQSESGMADLVERLTKPGQLVCDPFLGGGTTAVVSLALGRRFVGCDTDASCVAQSLQRVKDATCYQS